MASTTSCGSSPMPRIRLDLVTRPASRAAVITDSERSNRKPGRIRLKIRGTVSTLCASTSGREEKTSASWSGSALKSGMSSSTPQPGSWAWIWRTVSAYSQAPPSGRSSRATPVTVAYLQAHRRDALGDPAGLVGVEVGRLAGVDLAEVAAPGALVATDEEGGLPVFPALVDVGAAGLFADGVQALAADQRLQLGVLRAGLQPGLDPLGLALDGHLAVADLEAEQFAAGRLERGSRGMCRSGRLTHDLHGTRRRTTPPLHEATGASDVMRRVDQALSPSMPGPWHVPAGLLVLVALGHLRGLLAQVGVGRSAVAGARTRRRTRSCRRSLGELGTGSSR